jgi:hypothetical protein
MMRSLSRQARMRCVERQPCFYGCGGAAQFDA